MTVSPSPQFRISQHRRIAWWGSGLACLLSVVGLVVSWLNPAIGSPLRPGLDFTGGTQIQLERQCAIKSCSPITAAEVEARLGSLTLPVGSKDQGPNLAGAKVQILDGGQSLLLRLPALSAEQSQVVISSIDGLAGPLKGSGGSVNTIGPTLGAQLLQGSVVSLLVSFAAIAVYISFRYDKIFAFLALLTLAHDVVITCGLFAWLGLFFGIEVDSLFAVSLITVAGYSVTDTVIVFDRIREQKKNLGHLPLADQVDVAVDATLTRSIYTSLTTLLPLLGLIFFGGSSLFWFAVALAVGIAVGSWSSIGVAPTLLPVLSRR